MRALLVASVSPSRSNSATPVGVGGEHDTAGAELFGGLGESLHRCGEPSGEGAGEQPGDQQRRPGDGGHDQPGAMHGGVDVGVGLGDTHHRGDLVVTAGGDRHGVDDRLGGVIERR